MTNPSIELDRIKEIKILITQTKAVGRFDQAVKDHDTDSVVGELMAAERSVEQLVLMSLSVTAETHPAISYWLRHQIAENSGLDFQTVDAVLSGDEFTVRYFES